MPGKANIDRLLGKVLRGNDQHRPLGIHAFDIDADERSAVDGRRFGMGDAAEQRKEK